MCFVVESGAFVEFITFHKQSPHRLIGQDRGVRLSHFLASAVKMFDDRTIEMALPFFRADILRKRLFRKSVELDQTFVGGPYSFDPALRREVQASANVEDCTDDRRGLDVSPGQARPLNSPDWVVFPEVDSWPKPVVGCLACQKLRTAQKYLGGFDTASVIGKNEVIQIRGTPALACRFRQSSHPS